MIDFGPIGNLIVVTVGLMLWSWSVVVAWDIWMAARAARQHFERENARAREQFGPSERAARPGDPRYYPPPPLR